MSEWISTKDSFPNENQTVVFIVDSSRSVCKYYHGMILAGRFKYFDYGDGFISPEFGTIGLGGLSASYWMPIPTLPKDI